MWVCIWRLACPNRATLLTVACFYFTMWRRFLNLSTYSSSQRHSSIWIRSGSRWRRYSLLKKLICRNVMVFPSILFWSCWLGDKEEVQLGYLYVVSSKCENIVQNNDLQSSQCGRYTLKSLPSKCGSFTSRVQFWQHSFVSFVIGAMLIPKCIISISRPQVQPIQFSQNIFDIA